MSHFAKLDENNVVVFVTKGRQEDDGLEAELTARTGDTYKQTSYNTRQNTHILGGTPFRGNYAGVGYSYDETLDVFLPPKPHASWTLNETCYCWEAPVVMPDDGGRYVWVEELGDWVAVPEPTE